MLQATPYRALSQRAQAINRGALNTASGLELHQFKWLENDALIGEIPPRWNLLVDYEKPVALSLSWPGSGALHRGGPYFNEYTG
jgi:hypothetical protein